MVAPNTRMMLAFLLSISDLQSCENLTEAENNTLKRVSDKLKANHNHPSIQETLMEMIDANDFLKKRYQEFFAQISSINDTSLKELLPTQSELEKLFPKEEVRGYFPEREPDWESNEFLNSTLPLVLRTPDIVETAKKLGLFAKLKNLLNKGKQN
jgi:predicted nuclease with TOPRIM domain